MSFINVDSDTDRLVAALIHRPGLESMEYSVTNFSQVFYLRARLGKQYFVYERVLDEHDRFTNILEHEGVELLEVEDLLAEALDASPLAREQFNTRFLESCGAHGMQLLEAIRQLLVSQPDGKSLVSLAVRGIRCKDVGLPDPTSEPLSHALGAEFSESTLLAGPLNTMFFVRDPAVIVGSGAVLSSMYWPDRAREALFYETIFKFHPRFTGTNIWYPANSSYHLEGGNILNLGNKSIAIGISERTDPATVDNLARELFFNTENSPVQQILAIQLPENIDRRIHLDAFMTKVDECSILVDPLLRDQFVGFHITPGARQNPLLKKTENLTQALHVALGTKPRLIPSGGRSSAALGREMANGAASVLSLRPGKVCACNGNPLICDELDRAGVDVIAVDVDELVYGYGGPCSLCMPIKRTLSSS